MKKLSMVVPMAVAAMVVAMILFLLTDTVSARDFGRGGGYQSYRGGGHYGGGENQRGGRFWRGFAVGTIGGVIVAPLFYPPKVYPAFCREKVVRAEYYVRDVNGRLFWIPPQTVTICH